MDNCGQDLVGRIDKSIFNVLIVSNPYTGLISKCLLCQMVLVSGSLDKFPQVLEFGVSNLFFLGIFHHLDYILSCVIPISNPLIKRIDMYLSNV